MSAITHTPAETALIDALDGAEGWRGDVRDALIERGLPTKRVEAWKWSDLRQASQGVTRLASKHADAIQSRADFEALTSVEAIIVANGYLNWWPDDEKLPQGLSVSVHQSPDDAMGLSNAIASLGAAIANDPKVNILQIAQSQDKPIHVSYHSLDREGFDGARIGVVVEDGVEACILETHEGQAGFSSRLTEITLGANSKFHHVILKDEADVAVSTTTTSVRLSTSSQYTQTILSFGSKLSRHETHITHPGEGAEVHLGGVYLLEEGRHADFTSSVTHTGPGGVTRQLVKGAAAAHARGVFQGKFKVERAAQKTDARMTHRALMLDERAEIDAKPELEIYADDVQCAHGNALGALDESALFYMRQRGLPEAKARALLIESFLAEPLDAISDEPLRDTLKTMLRDRLKAMTT
jgi:Fe-S cluster assembly protein SufD